MKASLPTFAFLNNLEHFISLMDLSDLDNLDISLEGRWAQVHPVVLCTLASAGLAVRRGGGKVTIVDSDIPVMRYFTRMGLHKFLGVEPDTTLTEHEAAGRFIPLTQIQNPKELEGFLTDMVPLLHASPEDSQPIQYVVSELVRNVLEHSGSPDGAVVAAQYYQSTNRVSIGVVDSGVGVLKSMRRAHNAGNDLNAIQLALRPGITGTTSRPGGTEFNAGAGLFFCKAIASVSQNSIVIFSGNGFFKLLRAADRNVLQVDPARDRATTRDDLPSWRGTVVGIDVSVDKNQAFSALLSLIRKSYSIETQALKKEYKKARFA